MNKVRTMLSEKKDSLIITASLLDIAGDIFQYIFLKSFVFPFPFNIIQKIICHYKVLSFAFQLYSPLAGIYRMLKIMHKQRLNSWTCLYHSDSAKDSGFFIHMKMCIADFISVSDEVLQSFRIRLRFLNQVPYPESDCVSLQWCLS